MPNYLLSIIQPDGEPPPPSVLGPVMAAVEAVRAEMQAAGAWVTTAALAPAREATVVWPTESAPVFTDGPFAEAREHIGGLVIITAPDLDAARAWGRKLAGALTLPIEIRAIRMP